MKILFHCLVKSEFLYLTSIVINIFLFWDSFDNASNSRGANGSFRGRCIRDSKCLGWYVTLFDVIHLEGEFKWSVASVEFPSLKHTDCFKSYLSVLYICLSTCVAMQPLVRTHLRLSIHYWHTLWGTWAFRWCGDLNLSPNGGYDI